MRKLGKTAGYVRDWVGGLRDVMDCGGERAEVLGDRERADLSSRWAVGPAMRARRGEPVDLAAPR